MMFSKTLLGTEAEAPCPSPWGKISRSGKKDARISECGRFDYRDQLTIFSAVPLDSSLGLSVRFPANSLTLPLISCNAPSVLSLVPDSMMS